MQINLIKKNPCIIQFKDLKTGQCFWSLSVGEGIVFMKIGSGIEPLLNKAIWLSENPGTLCTFDPGTEVELLNNPILSVEQE